MLNLKTIEFTTCKLVFPFGTTREQVETLLKKYTADFTTHNFYDDMMMGCNRVAFGVFDIPEATTHDLCNKEKELVTHIDLMTSFHKKPSGAECCTPGGG